MKWRVRQTRCNNYDLLIIRSLNMFWASLCPSSGALDRMLLHMVFSTWCAGWCVGEPGSRPCALCTQCTRPASGWSHTSFHIKDARSYEHQCLMLSMLQSYSCDEPVFWARSQSCEIRLLASSCPSVCTSVSARLPLKVKFRIGDFYENLSRKSRLG